MLNQSGDEPVECPLCMEPLEVDDLTFFPCTCGYQICRFCWHRIRTDENGLCPACRKAYPENPADFRPLSKEEVVRLKVQKKQKDQRRRQKVMENRKHLANVRVVQRNLVFVVGLPSRLADVEVLKKHEYFGKYGKIQKVVINQSTSYAGSQGPSASAYVTYQKGDDALRAIQAVNNIIVDGRPIRCSLGTTKYCSNFLKNQMCLKPDCMYLHELGDTEASFTKEDMQRGKHQEYEKKLHEQLLHVYRERKPNSHIPVHVNSQSGASTCCSSYVENDVKEMSSKCAEFTSVGNNSDSNIPRVDSSNIDSNYQRYKGFHHSNSLLKKHSSEEEIKRKEECHKSRCKHKQSSDLPFRKSYAVHNSENSHTHGFGNNADLRNLEHEDNLKAFIVDQNSVLPEENPLEKVNREMLATQNVPFKNSNNNSFSSNGYVEREAINVQGVFLPKYWQTGFLAADSADVHEWSRGLKLTSESHIIEEFSQLHSSSVRENGVCVSSPKDNPYCSHVEGNLSSPLVKSKSTEHTDTHAKITSEFNAEIKNIGSNGAFVSSPLTSNRDISHSSSSVLYDPALVKRNHFSGIENGSQLLFMNGQPRFLGDNQHAYEKESQLQQELFSHGREPSEMKCKFNMSNSEKKIAAETVKQRRHHNTKNEKVEIVKGNYPPGFLHHQHKNKDTDVNYMNSIINPIVSGVQPTDSRRSGDDELGFDPFHETQKALAEMMKKENVMQYNHHNRFVSNHMPEHVTCTQVNCHPANLCSNCQQHNVPTQNHRSVVSGCTKLFNDLQINSGVSIPRARLPPPGFASTPSHLKAFTISQSQADGDL